MIMLRTRSSDTVELRQQTIQKGECGRTPQELSRDEQVPARSHEGHR